MIIFPAIDIQNGECVRLTKGDFETAERVAEDPVKTALSFKEAGAEWIHMVDLDGAKTAQVQNRSVFLDVAKETGLKVEVGGGIRDIKTAEFYLENGIERVIVGSMAIHNPKLVAELVREYGDRIAVGIDADGGQVKIDGWLNEGKVNFLTLAREMDYIGVRQIIYTDISKDGTLSGPNLDDLRKLRSNVEMNIVASGGITGIEDIKALAKLGLYGAICGKSLYHGTLDLKEAIEEAAKPVEVEAKLVSEKKPETPQKQQNRRPSSPRRQNDAQKGKNGGKPGGRYGNRSNNNGNSNGRYRKNEAGKPENKTGGKPCSPNE